MPRKWYPKKRRNYKKRRRRKNPLRSMVRIGQANFPQRFKYAAQITLNATSVSAAHHSFRANSLYDPDYTGTGESAMNFDKLMAFYNHYTVTGARIKCTFIPQTTTPSSVSSIISIQTDADATATTDLQDLLMQQNATTKVLSVDKALVITRNLSVKKFLGQNPLAEDANSGRINTNPSEEIFFHIVQSPTASGTDPSVVDVLVELEYYAILHEPQSQAI